MQIECFRLNHIINCTPNENKFKILEHASFINWVFYVPTKIAISKHHYENQFKKMHGNSLTGSPKRRKNIERRKI
jgi:hypothetical protein